MDKKVIAGGAALVGVLIGGTVLAVSKFRKELVNSGMTTREFVAAKMEMRKGKKAAAKQAKDAGGAVHYCEAVVCE
jgi:hypothetical protein